MSIEIRRIVETRAPLPLASAYLADFTHTNEWDPGTVTCTLVEGDGGVGTRYANVSRFVGREVSLTYVVTEVTPEGITWRAETSSTTSVDTVTFAATPDGGTRVVYHAVFDFTGPIALFMPLFRGAFRRLGDRAERSMRVALDALVV